MIHDFSDFELRDRAAARPRLGRVRSAHADGGGLVTAGKPVAQQPYGRAAVHWDIRRYRGKDGGR